VTWPDLCRGPGTFRPVGTSDPEMEPGRPGHGSKGRRVNILGQVGSGHGSVYNTHDPVF